MLQTISSADRYHRDLGWLSARWHFSFDSYYDPKNMHWGPLRVFNDDVIQPGTGFPVHPHRDMEIITVVLEGELEHTDSLGTRHVLRPGEVQVMSAGKGISHSEGNPSKTNPLHLMQIWILPRTKGREPQWNQKEFPDRRGKLLPVVSSGAIEGTLEIDQDAVIYLSELAAGETVAHQAGENRKAYLFVMRGEVEVNGTKVSSGDQVRIDQEQEILLTAKSASDFILLDLPR